jgi:hypothetical protein
MRLAVGKPLEAPRHARVPGIGLTSAKAHFLRGGRKGSRWRRTHKSSALPPFRPSALPPFRPSALPVQIPSSGRVRRAPPAKVREARWARRSPALAAALASGKDEMRARPHAGGPPAFRFAVATRNCLLRSPGEGVPALPVPAAHDISGSVTHVAVVRRGVARHGQHCTDHDGSHVAARCTLAGSRPPAFFEGR